MKYRMMLALGLLILGGAGCTMQLSPDDDLVRRVGALEQWREGVDVWSNKTVSDMNQALNALNARKADKPGVGAAGQTPAPAPQAQP